MAKVKNARDTRYAILWIACREALLREGVESDDAIRARRSWACWEATAGRGEDQRTEDYEKLSLVELREAARLANPHYSKKKEKAPEQMRKLLFYHAMYCAIHFIDLSGARYTHKGVAASGDALRGVLWSIFQRREIMPNNLFLLLCNGWINRKMNQFLHEAKLRGQARRPDEFYITSLTVQECSKLIDRFRRISQKLPPAPVARVVDMSNN